MTAATMTTIVQKETWIALLGRRDTPVDGVEDYCTFLGRALAAKGIELRLARVPWMDNGWIGGLRWLARRERRLARQMGDRAIHGAQLVAPRISVLRARGGGDSSPSRRACSNGLHEPTRHAGSRWIDHVRGASQSWVIRKLYHGAEKCIFADPLETIAWLPNDRTRATFIPIGGNIPRADSLPRYFRSTRRLREDRREVFLRERAAPSGVRSGRTLLTR